VYCKSTIPVSRRVDGRWVRSNPEDLPGGGCTCLEMLRPERRSCVEERGSVRRGIVNEDLVGRVEKLEAQAHQREVRRKSIRRRVRAVLLALVVHLLAAGGCMIHYVKASGSAEEHEQQQNRDILRLEQDVRELRRICGLEPPGVVRFGLLEQP